MNLSPTELEHHRNEIRKFRETSFLSEIFFAQDLIKAILGISKNDTNSQLPNCQITQLPVFHFFIPKKQHKNHRTQNSKYCWHDENFRPVGWPFNSE